MNLAERKLFGDESRGIRKASALRSHTWCKKLSNVPIYPKYHPKDGTK